MQADQFFPLGILDTPILNKSEESSPRLNERLKISAVFAFPEALSVCPGTVLTALHTSFYLTFTTTLRRGWYYLPF